MADTYIKISELEETSLADDASFIPIDNGNHTYKITVENYNSGANATAKSYAEAAAASADDADAAKTAAETAETETGLIRTATQQYATAASGSASAAASSAVDALNYADSAASAAANAADSAQDAAESYTNAAEKAVLSESWAVGGTNTRTGEDTNNSQYYAAVAKSAAENAEDQVELANAASQAASGSAVDAAASATEASGYAGDASDSASDASTSASAAATQATNAANSAGAAATSATNAAASATAASGSASTATTQATNAAQSATTAGGYATQAASSASDASGYATNAANSATAAAGSATTASNQATAAAGSATAAAASASDAADSAADAAESAATFTTDDTLSIAGKAADAKAAGDMIAAVQAEIPELDNWLTTPGAAAEAKHTGDRITEVEDDVADLKSATDYNTLNIDVIAWQINDDFPLNIKWENGRLTDGVPSSGSNNQRTADFIDLSQIGYNNLVVSFEVSGLSVYIVQYDSTKTFISTIPHYAAGSYSPEDNNTKYVKLFTYSTTIAQADQGSYVSAKYHNTDSIERTQDIVDEVVTHTHNIFNGVLSNIGFASGAIEANDNYRAYYWLVENGEKYTISRKNTTDFNRFRFAFTTELPANGVTMYKANGQAGSPNSAGDSLTVQSFTVPSTQTFKYAVVYLSNLGQTIDDTCELMINSGDTALPWEPYYTGYAAIDKDARQNINIIKAEIDDVQDQLGDSNNIIYTNDVVNTVDRLQQANRANRWPSSTLDTPPIVLLHFSDIHADATNIARIAEYYAKYGAYIDDAIHTGDVVRTVYTEGITLFDALPTALQVIGNHDSRVGTDYHGATADECYTNYFAPYISQWGVTYQQNVCYYFKDYPDNHIRLIVLDYMHETTDQLNWFANTLASAKTLGYTVVVGVHVTPTGLTPLDTQFDSQVLTEYYDAHRDQRFDYMSDDYPDAVDAFIADGGKFACWLTGHTHFSIFAQVTNHPNQIAIAVSNAGILYADSSEADRQVGTKSQDCFNVVVIDDYSSLVKLMRVGCDYTRWFKHPDTVCWDFANKVFLS